MPDIGYQSPAGDDSNHLLVMRGNRITMTEAGVAGVTVTFRCGDDANTAGDSVKVGIFNSTGSTLLAESAVRTDISTQGEYTFSGGGLATFTPANSTTYILAILANNVSVYVVFDNIVSPGGIWVSDDNVSAFGPPMAFTGTIPAAGTDTKSAIGYMTYTAAGGVPAPAITDVDTDESITATQTNVVITGTNFATAVVTLRDGALTSTQSIDSQNATTIQIDVVLGDVRYGSRTLRVTNSDAQFADQAVAVTAPAGKAFVDLVSVNGVAANRITAVADLAIGDQLEISNVRGGVIGDVTVNTDATFDCAVAVTAFDVRVNDGTGWGSIATQTVGAVTPEFASGAGRKRDRRRRGFQILIGGRG